MINPPYQSVSVFSAITVTCSAKGYPLPTIHWILDNEAVRNDSNTIITSLYPQDCPFKSACTSSSTLHIRNILPFHSVTYKCMAVNVAGNDIKDFKLVVKGMKYCTAI